MTTSAIQLALTLTTMASICREAGCSHSYVRKCKAEGRVPDGKKGRAVAAAIETITGGRVLAADVLAIGGPSAPGQPEPPPLRALTRDAKLGGEKTRLTVEERNRALPEPNGSAAAPGPRPPSQTDAEMRAAADDAAFNIVDNFEWEKRDDVLTASRKAEARKKIADALLAEARVEGMVVSNAEQFGDLVPTATVRRRIERAATSFRKDIDISIRQVETSCCEKCREEASAMLTQCLADLRSNVMEALGGA